MRAPQTSSRAASPLTRNTARLPPQLRTAGSNKRWSLDRVKLCSQTGNWDTIAYYCGKQLQGASNVTLEKLVRGWVVGGGEDTGCLGAGFGAACTGCL